MSTTQRRPVRRGPHGRGPAEKPKDFKKASGQLLRFLKPFLAMIVAALVFAVAGTVLNLIGPNILSDLTDAIQGSFVYLPDLGLGLPVLGFCYGHQIMAVTLGGEVAHSAHGHGLNDRNG